MGTNKRVFISYSHDSEAHRERVLGLSERLRADGIETTLDRYVNGTPDNGWPRWMLDGLDAADRVLLVCTPTYYRRFRGHEEPGKGKGVDWEGAVITQAIYDARSATTRFIPVLFDPADADLIPEPVRGQSFYCLTSDSAYQDLCDALFDRAGVEPGPVGDVKPRERPRGKPLTFGGPGDAGTAEPPPIDLNQLPPGTEHFFGREREMAALDAAWSGAEADRPAICELIAPGGTGKTALVQRWLGQMQADHWRGAERVYGWSFFSQGSGDGREASEDLFLARAIAWFGVDIDPAAHPTDKGRALADRLQTGRTLLILDGLEPLQHPPGPLAGELRAPGLKALLGQLAAAGHPGLCLVTSREWLQDLSFRVRTDTNPQGPVLRLDLQALSDTDGARLLHARGANQAGAAEIAPDDPELLAASRDVRGHALTLSLLGGYLGLAQEGDIRRRDQVDLHQADTETAAGRVFRVMAAYERWLTPPDPAAGATPSRELAALRLFGFFDRPARPELLEALREAPPIPGLTEALFAPGAAPGTAGVSPAPAPNDPTSTVRILALARNAWQSLTHRKPPIGGVPAGGRRSQEATPDPIPPTQWRTALTRLEQIGLLYPPDPSGARDAHPLVREYLAHALKTRCPDAWREGHRRLYERLKGSVPHRPDGLDGLQPLYQAVAHGCQAGLYEEARVQVYRDRILRGTGDDGFYSIHKLGAFGADLGAIACLFAEPWTRPAPALTEADQAWLHNEAAFRLRALGRLGEALGPMRAGAEMRVKQEDWKNASISYGNLSELELTLGQVPEAVADARRSLDHAERSGDASWRMIIRTTLADALHQQGETGEARRLFAEAEALQAEDQPQYPLLYSLRGFLYCDLLLAGAEGAAWSAVGGGPAEGAGGGLGGPGDGAGAAGTGGDPGWAAACEAAARRAGQALKIAETSNLSLLNVALDHLTLARCALYADHLAGRPPGPEAQDQARLALDGLRAAGRQDYLPRGLLTRAWLRQAQGDTAGARADLAEAEQIASRGAMALHLADIALYRARLFRDPQALAQARRLIDTHGYRRRLPELEAAESAAPLWERLSAATRRLPSAALDDDPS